MASLQFKLSTDQESRTLDIYAQHFINHDDTQQESGVYEILENGFPLGDVVIKMDGDDYDYTGNVLSADEVSQVVEFILDTQSK